MSNAADLSHEQAFPGVPSDPEHAYGLGLEDGRSVTPEEWQRYLRTRQIVALRPEDVERVARRFGWVEGRDFVIDPERDQYQRADESSYRRPVFAPKTRLPE